VLWVGRFHRRKEAMYSPDSVRSFFCPSYYWKRYEQILIPVYCNTGPNNPSLESITKKAQLSLGKTGYGLYSFCWLPRSSKVDDFHLIWKGVCDFLWVINSNLDPISHCFRDIARFPLKSTHFSYPFYSAPNLKMFLTHYIPKICTQRAITQS